jgi:NAD+ kinase
VTAVKRVGILVATHKVGVDNALNALVTLLESWGAEILMPEEVAQRVGRPQAVDLETLRTADLLIALGGDGCVLSAARLAAPFAIPILGIRLGGFGFLAEVEASEMETALRRLWEGDFVLDERLMLQVTHQRESSTDWSSIGLNDAILLKTPASPLPSWEVWVNDELLARYPADGVAVATPTGSTAYTLSAGGPILAPDVDALLLMPMYAHTLTLRPLVLPSQSRVQVRLLPQRRPVAGEISVDGQETHPIAPDDCVTVTAAPFRAKIVRLGGFSFFTRLRQKLRWGERQ